MNGERNEVRMRVPKFDRCGRLLGAHVRALAPALCQLSRTIQFLQAGLGSPRRRSGPPVGTLRQLAQGLLGCAQERRLGIAQGLPHIPR